MFHRALSCSLSSTQFDFVLEPRKCVSNIPKQIQNKCADQIMRQRMRLWWELTWVMCKPKCDRCIVRHVRLPTLGIRWRHWVRWTCGRNCGRRRLRWIARWIQIHPQNDRWRRRSPSRCRSRATSAAVDCRRIYTSTSTYELNGCFNNNI